MPDLWVANPEAYPLMDRFYRDVNGAPDYLPEEPVDSQKFHQRLHIF